VKETLERTRSFKNRLWFSKTGGKILDLVLSLRRFFGSCSEFNTIIFFFFLFSGDNFQESDKYAIQARIDSV